MTLQSDGTFDVSELVEFAMDIEGVRENIGPRLVSAFHVSSRNIKDDWNKSLGAVGTRRMRHIGRTVDYDITGVAEQGGSSIQSEIGPNLGRKQGSFAGWFEEGAANVPATHGGANALKRYRDDVENGIALAAVDAILDATK